MTRFTRREAIAAAVAAALSSTLLPAATGADEMTITPFKIEIPQAQIDDLRERLTMTRWPVSVGDGWGDLLVEDIRKFFGSLV